MGDSGQGDVLPLAAAGVGSTIFIVLLVALVVLGRRSKKLRIQLGYPKGRRVRLIALLFLEPLLELLIVGVLLWQEITTDLLHLAVALLAILPAILLGRYRANESFVEALPVHKAVVVSHTKGELIGFAVIVLCKVLEQQAESASTPEFRRRSSGRRKSVLTCLKALRHTSSKPAFAASSATWRSSTA